MSRPCPLCHQTMDPGTSQLFQSRTYHHDCLVSWARYSPGVALPNDGGVLPQEYAQRQYLPIQSQTAQIKNEASILAASLVAENRMQQQQQQQQQQAIAPPFDPSPSAGSSSNSNSNSNSSSSSSSGGIRPGGAIPKRALIIAVDTSGSMMANAAAADGDGDQVSCLQLVGHAVRTVLASVAAQAAESPVGVITFATNVEVISPPRKLTTDIVTQLSNRVELLYPSGTTNMWGALSEAMKMSKPLIDQGMEVDVFLFTDGVPTESSNPVRGILPTLTREYQKVALSSPNDSNSRLFIHTLGFGPSIDSDLLLNISTIGNGIFKYISDPGMVGTVLINSICKFICDVRDGRRAPKSPMPCTGFMTELISHLKFAPDELEKARKMLRDGLQANSTHPLALDREQLQIAVSNVDFVKTWGLHFYRTLLSCHTHAHCGNFKDPGLQGYADAAFQDLQSEVEDIFKRIDPPKGAQIRSIEAYVDPHGGCVSTHSMISMADGTLRSAGTLRRGDSVLTGAGSVAKVDFVLINRDMPKSKMVAIRRSGDHSVVLLITSWHPIRIDGRWVFPAALPSSPSDTSLFYSTPLPYSGYETTSVVTFLLENPTENQSIIADGIEAITLAHGIVGDDVASHHFYGSDSVVHYIHHLAATNCDDGLVCDDPSSLKQAARASWLRMTQIMI